MYLSIREDIYVKKPKSTCKYYLVLFVNSPIIFLSEIDGIEVHNIVKKKTNKEKNEVKDSGCNYILSKLHKKGF